MNVSAIIVTRGDVDLLEIIDSLPDEWERVVWDNGHGEIRVSGRRGWGVTAGDVSVYGRYAAIEYASNDLIYVQDDDVIVSDPDAIRGAWQREANEWYRTEHLYTEGEKPPWPGVVANMPQEFRHSGYTDSCLVGFGACFHRDAPQRAFKRFEEETGDCYIEAAPLFQRTCDVVFTTLNDRVLVDVPRRNLPHAYDGTRMYRQPGHVGERAKMLELARRCRDAQ